MSRYGLVDGTQVFAGDYSADEWAEFQAAVHAGSLRVVMPYCDCAGHLSRSAIGTQFFAHNPGAASRCEYAAAGEGDDHLHAKRVIADAARRAGWSADYERRVSSGSRPDVLLTEPGGGARVAVEVQVSRQTIGRYLYRTGRYAGLARAVWFVERSIFEWSRMPDRVEAYPIEFQQQGIVVTGLGADGQQAELVGRVVFDLLGGQVPIRPPRPGSDRRYLGRRPAFGRMPGDSQGWEPGEAREVLAGEWKARPGVSFVDMLHATHERSRERASDQDPWGGKA